MHNKRLLTRIFLFVFFLGGTLGSTPDEFNRYFIDAAGKAKPSVVTITIYKEGPKKNPHKLKKIAYASGTIIDSQGIIVTNYHVVIKGDFYQVVNASGYALELYQFDEGQYYLSDPKTDIAIMKIKNPEQVSLEPISFADSMDLSQGEWVIAIGNPYGLAQSITCGIVSSTGRDNIGFTDIEDFIQSDVPINPGNSGGPLVNLHGDMVGINTAISTVSGGYQGISFAIPSNIVRQVCHELMTYGRVRRGWLGFMAREQKTGGKDSRVIVESVIKGSPAESAGIRRGDIILEIDRKVVATIGSLIKVVANKPVGSKLWITVSREGTLHDVAVVLREKREYTRIRKELTALFDIYGIEIDENSGKNDVIVSFVSPRSLLYDIKRGDVIVSVNGAKVFSLNDFIKIFYRSGRRIRNMTICREDHIYTVEFPDM